MRLIDLYPSQGVFSPGQPVGLVAKLTGRPGLAGVLRLTIRHLSRSLATFELPVELDSDLHTTRIEWRPSSPERRGYGVGADLYDQLGQLQDHLSTAFDVLPNWTDFPRYGFLTEFAADRPECEATLLKLKKYHLNGLQFYDWQYRHDILLPPGETYADPLGRPSSLRIVRELAATAQSLGMAPMAYLAIYAASIEFWRAHPGWALYDAAGLPLSFGEGFLGLMDPTPGRPWSEHLINECSRMLAAIPFRGLHIDQYGEPRTAFDHKGEPVDLPRAFVAFVEAARDRNPGVAITFNAVDGWPLQQVAASSQDFVYIEVGASAPTYDDLAMTIDRAQRVSGGKPVVIALYLPADRPQNIRLADALIFGAGASRIELGECDRLLTDPYFPKHSGLTDELRTILRHYYDFAVRYGELFGPSSESGDPNSLRIEADVWALPRLSRGWSTVCLINRTGLGNPRWDRPVGAPAPLRDVCIRIAQRNSPRAAFWASPDSDQVDLVPLDLKATGSWLEVVLPNLDYWSIVVLEHP